MSLCMCNACVQNRYDRPVIKYSWSNSPQSAFLYKFSHNCAMFGNALLNILKYEGIWCMIKLGVELLQCPSQNV